MKMNEEEKSKEVESKATDGNDDNGVLKKTKKETLTEREELIEKEEDLQNREDELKARRELGGTSEAGQIPEEPTKETPEDYSKRIMGNQIK